MTTEETPHRRLRMSLDLEADDIDEMSRALESIALNLATTDTAADPEQRQNTSGGYGSGWHFTVTCNPDQTGDGYRDELREWMAARREAKVQ